MTKGIVKGIIANLVFVRGGWPCGTKRDLLY